MSVLVNPFSTWRLHVAWMYYGDCAHEQHVRRILTLTHTITAYSVSGNVVRVYILICATRQTPRRKRVYRLFYKHNELRPVNNSLVTGRNILSTNHGVSASSAVRTVTTARGLVDNDNNSSQPSLSHHITSHHRGFCQRHRGIINVVSFQQLYYDEI